MATIDLVKFNELVAEHYLSVQRHDTASLLIWNYTEKCQYGRYWTPETLMARGLVTDLDGNLVARPFKKFFNYEEHVGQDSKLPPLPLEEFDVYDKLDGSLGILYWIGDTPYITTRGSFNSDQAKEGTKMLYGYDWSELNKNYTYLFEILYPENRIVVDYCGRRELILLAVFDTETGEEKSLYDECGPFPFVAGHIHCWAGEPLTKFKETASDNKEGFVIRFKSGVRCKLKFEEYVRLHRLITGVNAKSIWELLKNNQPFDELMERVPDEFYQWVRDTKESLEKEYKAREYVSKELYGRVFRLPTRKDQALFLQEFSSRGIVFAMLDEKDYSPLIWKMLKPKAEKPFRKDIDA